MKASTKSALLGFAAGTATSFVAGVLTTSLSRLTVPKVRPEMVFLSAWTVLLTAVIILYLRRMDRSTKSRIDLLFRMSYQGPFAREIREGKDEEEKIKYRASILRKLRSLSEYKKLYGDTDFCSYYIGCLAFLANENRAALPWNEFQQELLAHFREEIINKKISKNVIVDHYGKDNWEALVFEANRPS